ncbi:MAG: LPS export ABC transporter periplasmic protein LptC [Hyphomicrobiales bacterium]
MTKFVSLASVCALFAMAGWFFIQAGTFGRIWHPETVKQDSLPKPDKSDVETAQFSGYDKSNDPFTVNADSAFRDENDPSKTHLRVVRGRLKTNESGKVLLMKSDTGIYESEQKMLDLAGNVELVSTDNYILFLADATIDVNAKRMRSDQPVHVIFDQGTIDAQAIEMWNNGNVVVFKNGVKMKIVPNSSVSKGDAQQ